MRILITGGAGAWGSHLCRWLIERGHTVCVYSRDEEKQRKLRASLGEEVRCFLGDVRDRDRLRRAMDGCSRVIHLAAMKQIDACTYNPMEAVRTNVDGTMNVIDTALDCQVGRVLCMSTDKAVEPTTLYGQTKAVVEGLIRNASAYGRTHFSALRCGNAWASTGSVVPVWKQLVAQGATELPVTSEECTRYTIMLHETAPMIFNFLEQQSPSGSIYAPRLPAYRVSDLVEAFGCKARITGLRPGEKVHESMVGSHEIRTLTNEIVAGSAPEHSRDADMLTVDELREMIKHA